VAVSLWTDSRISRHRREAARETADETAGKTARRDPGGAARQPVADLSPDPDRPKPDGHGG
jgi:hypothetical protein